MRFAPVLMLIALPLFGVAQDFSISILDENGKEFPDSLGLIPPLMKVKITSVNPSKKFRFQKAEVIQSRQKVRVATIEMLSSNIDLRNFYGQTRKGDHLVLNVFVEESEGEKIIKTHRKAFDYFLSGKE